MTDRKRKTLLWSVMILAVAGLLYMQGPITFTPLSDRLVSESEVIRHAAHKKLRKLSEEKKRALLPGLVKAYYEGSVQNKKFSLYALRRLGFITEEIKLVVFDALGSSDEEIAREAIVFLGESDFSLSVEVLENIHQFPFVTRVMFGKMLILLPEKAGPALLDNLSNPDDNARLFSLERLRKLPNITDLNQAPVKKLINDKDTAGRLEAALCLVDMGYRGNEVIPRFLDGFGIPSRRVEIAQAFEKMGKTAQGAAPTLMELLGEAQDGFLEEIYFKPALARALQAVSPAATSQAAIKSDLKRSDPSVRYRAAWYLSTQTEPSPVFAKDLVARLDDPNRTVAARALLALGKIGIKNLPRFEAEIIDWSLRNLNKEMKKETVEGFSSLISQTLSPMGSDLTPRLLEEMKKGNLSAKAVDKIIQSWKPFEIKSLEALTGYGDPTVRFLAALNLSRVGSRNTELVPLLLEENAKVGIELKEEGEQWAKRIETF